MPTYVFAKGERIKMRTRDMAVKSYTNGDDMMIHYVFLLRNLLIVSDDHDFLLG
jgi:hypothetical protein